MKRKQLLTKTFLIAAMLCLGMSAWAEDVYTTVYQKTYATGANQWAAADVTAWGSASNLAVDATTTFFGFAQTGTQNKNGSASYNISTIKDNAKVKYEAEWYVKSTNGGYGACYSYLKLGNFYIRATDNYKGNDIAFSTDGGTTYCDNLNTKKTESWVRSGNIVTVTAILNTANNTVESMSVVFDGTTYTTSNLTTTILGGANNKVIGLQSSTTRSGSSGSQLKSITVSQCEQEVSVADYTINYIYNGETIKTVSGSRSVSSTVYAESPVTISDTRYYAKDGEVTSMEITSGTNVLNVDYRLAETYRYTVKAVDGSSNVLDDNLASGSVTEGDGTTVKYPRYVLSGTTLYASGTGTVTYSTTFTPDKDNYVKNITYNSGTVNNVVFYTEGEAVSGASVGANDARASKGQMGYTADENTFLDATTLALGKYKIYMRTQNGNSNARPFKFKVGDDIVFTGSFGNGTNTDANSDEFTVTESSTLSFASVGSQQSGIDYFYVVKTGERFDVGDEIITNGSFATNADGWTLDNYTRKADAGQNSTPVVESWNNTGRAAGSVTQSVGYLPAGNYAISASILSGAESYLKVLDASDDSEIASIECTGSWYDRTVAKSFTLSEIKDVKVQFSTPAQAEGTWWSYITNVSMIYYGSETPVESKMAVSASNIAKYGTFYAPYDVKIPILIKAYTAQNNAAETGLTLTEITDGIIPAYTPVILENNRANDNTFNGVFYGLAAEGSQASSALTGTLEEYSLQEGDYIMQYQNNVTAFYPVSGDAIGKTIVANRCYIKAVTVAKAYLAIAPNDVTGVKSVSADAKNVPMKRIVNGQLVIEKDGKQYNALGQEK